MLQPLPTSAVTGIEFSFVSRRQTGRTCCCSFWFTID